MLQERNVYTFYNGLRFKKTPPPPTFAIVQLKPMQPQIVNSDARYFNKRRTMTVSYTH